MERTIETETTYLTNLVARINEADKRGETVKRENLIRVYQAANHELQAAFGNEAADTIARTACQANGIPVTW